MSNLTVTLDHDRKTRPVSGEWGTGREYDRLQIEAHKPQTQETTEALQFLW